MNLLERIAPENRPIVIAAFFVVVIVLLGTVYTLSTQGTAPMLSPPYLLQQLQIGSFLGICAAVTASEPERKSFVNDVSRRNVWNSIDEILDQSEAIRRSVDAGTTKIVGAMYDVNTGKVELLQREATNAS